GVAGGWIPAAAGLEVPDSTSDAVERWPGAAVERCGVLALLPVRSSAGLALRLPVRFDVLAWRLRSSAAIERWPGAAACRCGCRCRRALRPVVASIRRRSARDSRPLRGTGAAFGTGTTKKGARRRP